jgi:hypothetical protein
LWRQAQPVSGSAGESGRRLTGSVPTAVDPELTNRRPALIQRGLHIVVLLS